MEILGSWNIFKMVAKVVKKQNFNFELNYLYQIQP